MKLVGAIALVLCLWDNAKEVPQASNNSVADVIDKLYSPDDSVRQDGLQQLRRLGPIAAESLIQLLAELVQDQSPRFPSGKEEAGKHVVEAYVREPHNEEPGNKLDEIAINSRLMSDCVDLLADLKAERAIPVLIQILNNSSGLTGGPELYALRAIGPAATSALIEDLDESRIRQYGFEPVSFGWSIETGATSTKNNNEEDGNDRIFEDQQIHRIRDKVLRLLGEIRDPHSLKGLERLLRVTNDKELSRSIVFTIGKIRESGSFKSKQPQFIPLIDPVNRTN